MGAWKGPVGAFNGMGGSQPGQQYRPQCVMISKKFLKNDEFEKYVIVV